MELTLKVSNQLMKDSFRILSKPDMAIVVDLVEDALRITPNKPFIKDLEAKLEADGVPEDVRKALLTVDVLATTSNIVSQILYQLSGVFFREKTDKFSDAEMHDFLKKYEMHK